MKPSIKIIFNVLLYLTYIIAFSSFDLMAVKKSVIDVTFDTSETYVEQLQSNNGTPFGVGPRIFFDKNREAITSAALASPYKMWISHEHQSGCCSLGLSIGPQKDENIPSKIEFNLIRGDSLGRKNLFTNHHPHLLSFSFLEDPSYENPLRWVLHFQVWQRPPLQPPLAMVVIPGQEKNSKFTKYVIITRTDKDVGKSLSWNNGSILKLLDGNEYFTIEKGKWHRLSFLLSPHPESINTNSSGVVAVWIDGVKIIDSSVNWGYSKGKDDEFGYFVKLGIYRVSQSTTQTVFFDNIKWEEKY